MKKITVWIATSLLLVAVTAAAETYRWVDAEGKVHYSDRPVEGAQEVQVKVPGDSPAATTATTPAEDDALPQSNTGAETAAEIRAKLCIDAKARLANYEQADGLYEDTPQGRRMLSLDERINEIVKAKQSVKETCEPPPS